MAAVSNISGMGLCADRIGEMCDGNRKGIGSILGKGFGFFFDEIRITRF